MGKRMTASDAIVEVMKREEVSHVFCVPGESYLPLMDSIYETDSIQMISTRHEGGAAFMAEAYGKATKKPGIAMATRGVGGSNLAIGIHTAYQDSTPMIVFLGQVHSKFRGREGFQEVDLDQFFGHIAKWTVELKDAERAPELIQRAFRVAQTGRPGPVVVSLPEDVLVEEAVMHFGPNVHLPKPHPDEKEIEEVGRLLEAAERPLILAGGGVIASHGEEMLITLAEKFEIPVMASFRRHDVFPNNHRLYAGHAGLGTFPAILETMKNADLVLAIGTRLSEVTTQDYQIFRHHPKLVHIDLSYETLGKVYAPDVGIVADAKAALDPLLKIEINKKWNDWASESRNAYEQSLKYNRTEDRQWVDNYDVITILQDKLPDDALIVTDAGNFAGWLQRFYSFNHPMTYFGPTSGAMGYGLPAAIGAKLVKPQKTVVCLSGDGGFMMTAQELETAVRYNIPIISLVFNNKSYGTIRMHQEMHYPDRVIGTDLNDVDFVKLGESLGVESYKVQSKQTFEAALTKALEAKGVALIEILSDPERLSVTETVQSIREKAKQRK